jgi:hypothetical protein
VLLLRAVDETHRRHAVAVILYHVQQKRQAHSAPDKAQLASMPALAPAKESKRATSSVEERIRRRAYELYLQRVNQPGSELNDWLQAEQEIQRTDEQAVGERSTPPRESSIWEQLDRDL